MKGCFNISQKNKFIGIWEVLANKRGLSAEV